MGSQNRQLAAVQEGPAVIWKVFDRVHRIWTDITGYADGIERMVRQMWEASPVSAGIVAACGLLSAVLLVLVIRVILRTLSRVRKLLARSAGPAARALRRRRILKRLASAPVAAVADYEIVAGGSDTTSATPVTAASVSQLGARYVMPVRRPRADTPDTSRR